MIRLEVRAGQGAKQSFELAQDEVAIGRDEGCAVCLRGPGIGERHARLVEAPDGLVIEDLRSGTPTARIRDGERRVAGESNGFRLFLRTGDLIELGGGQDATVLALSLEPDSVATKIVTVRRLEELETKSQELLSQTLSRIHDLQERIGSADGLDEVNSEVADAALDLIPKATHATLVLADGEDDTNAESYVPVLTRVRGSSGKGESHHAVPVARSVFRKVVAERAVVMAADAHKEVGGADSLLGANIRSTIGVPLFAGEVLIGVLQVDNRDAPAMFSGKDVDKLAVLSASASLAVANARLIQRLKRAEDRLRKENNYLKGREAARRGANQQVIGKSEAMGKLSADIDRVANVRVSVLIQGETGTGKELVASALHYRSKRASKLFVTQNCAAMPENLLESELFGHKRGSFTGATEEKKGLFELADGGTLFLDEVGEMALPLQAKLLRVLQEGEVRPIGATHPRHVDVRIVAATNRNLEKEVAEGRFREDLYYRLGVFPLKVPPLRKRREDVPLLAGYFLQRYSKEMGRVTGGFAQQTMELLVAYDFPGNVRELQNEVQRLVIQADEDQILSPDLLSRHVRKIEGTLEKAGAGKGNLKERMEAVEKFILLETLAQHGNNKTQSAKTLGITREGLHKKLRNLGLT